MNIRHSAVFAGLVLWSGLSVFAKTWNGPDGGDLANTANYTGAGGTFYPNNQVFPWRASPYRVTTSADVSYAITELAANANVTFDLAPYAMVVKNSNNDTFRAMSSGQTVNWVSGTLITSNLGAKATSVFSVQVNARNVRFFADGPNAVIRSGFLYRDGYDCLLEIKNGAHVYGSVSMTGHSNNVARVVGEGTYLDCRKSQLVAGPNHMQIYIGDGAVVTNVSGFSCGEATSGEYAGGYSLLDVDRVCGRNMGFMLGSSGGPHNTIRLHRSNVHFNALQNHIARNSPYSLLDLTEGTVFSVTGAAITPLGVQAGAHHSTVLVRGASTFSNTVTGVQVGWFASHCLFDVKEGSTFYSPSLQIGCNSTYTNVFCISDSGSRGRAGGVVIGTETTNSLFHQGHRMEIRDDARFDCSGRLTCAGYYNTIVVSNGALSVGGRLDSVQNNGKGGRSTLILSGKTPSVQNGNDIYWNANSVIRFDLPVGGYETPPITTTGQFDMRWGWFEFTGVKRIAAMGGGTIRLATFRPRTPNYQYGMRPYQNLATDQALWNQIVSKLPEGCELICDQTAGTLDLKIKPGPVGFAAVWK